MAMSPRILITTKYEYGATSPRILIAEEDVLHRDLLQRIITQLYPAATITIVADSNSVLTTYVQQGADLIIAAEGRQGLPGSALIRQLRFHGATIPIILWSSAIAVGAISIDGLTHFMQKPIAVADLVRSIRQMLA